MAIKAVIFDLDGTLLNTIEDLADAMNTVLLKRGFSKHSVKNYKSFVGNGIENMVKQALPVYFSNNEEIVSECITLFKSEYESIWNKKTQPYSGINILLDNFDAAKIKKCILSNKPDEFVQKVIKHYFTKWEFEYVVGAKKGQPLKPDPKVVNDLIDKMGVSKEECLYIGDTDTDMKTGKNAGVFTIGAAWGFRDEDELTEAGADYCANIPEDIIEYLLKKTA